MLQAIERYMKQAIVDKVHSVSSAALTSSLVGVKASVYLFVEYFYYLKEFLTTPKSLIILQNIALHVHEN